METVKVNVDEQFSDRQFYRESPLKTNKLSLSLYDFEPWQSLPMQRNPGSDTIMYFVDGDAFMLINDGVFSVSPGDAMFVPANSVYGVLAGENDLNVVAVQCPKPVEAEKEQGLIFRRPQCELEAPLTTGTETGDINMCPRCETMVKLTKQPNSYRAEKTEEAPPEEKLEEKITEPTLSAEGQGEPQARMEFGVIDFQPW
jgi:quercetin dioxygenase-like cupin family protein